VCVCVRESESGTLENKKESERGLCVCVYERERVGTLKNE
jgi:hypothetical protein